LAVMQKKKQATDTGLSFDEYIFGF